jgi:hypothetical protein
MQLRHRLAVVYNVFEHVIADDRVEGCIRKANVRDVHPGHHLLSGDVGRQVFDVGVRLQNLCESGFRGNMKHLVRRLEDVCLVAEKEIQQPLSVGGIANRAQHVGPIATTNHAFVLENLELQAGRQKTSQSRAAEGTQVLEPEVRRSTIRTSNERPQPRRDESFQAALRRSGHFEIVRHCHETPV